MKLQTLVVIAAAFTTVATTASATDCSAWSRFSTNRAYLEPLSVDTSEVGSFFSSYKYAGGVQLSSEMRSDELWIDITEFPGDTTAAAASRIVMQIGRLVEDDFNALVLAEGQTGLFRVPEPELRRIGCQFIWGIEGGENPIALMRELFKSMEHYETGKPVSTNWNGSLLGDTTLALDINNTLFLPKWVMSAVR